MQNRIKQKSVISSFKRCFSYLQFGLLSHRKGNTKRRMISITLSPSKLAFNTKFMSKTLNFDYYFLFTKNVFMKNYVSY